MAKRGRKDKYEELVKPHLSEINKKIRQGVIEEEIAKALNISVATLNNYKQKHPELKEALNKGKGADVLQGLINAGITAAMGYFKENETITFTLDDEGKPTKRKVVNKIWYKPDASLNKFYVMNYGKNEGFTNDPLDYEIKKARAELDEAQAKEKDWFK